jgi:ABC-type sugar transport system ATPase subunit
MEIPALKLEGIDKCFPGTQALQNVNFEAYPGKVSALVGANGAGKSTLIKIVSGAIGKDAGTISLNGDQCNLSGF